MYNMKLIVYHVTSTIFINSIKEHGLIGIDIRHKLPKLSEAMSEIIDTLDRNYADLGCDWGEAIGFRANCQRMADSKYKNQSGMDYEYGSVYVTSSKSRISIYNSYEFGSELITYFFKLYQCLYQKHRDKSKAEFDSKYPELIKIISIENKGNLVLKAEVDTSDLMTDTGKILNEEDIKSIQFMQKACNGDVQRSYRMSRTLRPDEIEIMTLDEETFKSVGKLSEYKIPSTWTQVEIV